MLKILHTLEQKVFYGDDGRDINWIGITSVGNSENSSWNIQPLGFYLYEGLGGIALFYNALQQSDFDVDLSAACKAFETMMFQYTDDMLERTTDLEKESSGAFAGESSVIYVYEVLYKITGKQKYLEYAEKHCKILEYALKADENNDLIYGNAGAVIVLLNLYHLSQKDIYLQLACEAGNILIKNQNKGKWCCGNGQSLSGLSHGIAGIIYALTKLNNEQFHIEYQNAIHFGLIYENTMYSDKYNNWLDNREEAKKEENSDNRCMAAWCHGAPGILLARSKMYNLVKDSSDYITVECDIERALFATKMYGLTDNDCLCHGNLGNTEILLEYSKECNDEEVRHMMLSARTQIAVDIINENYDCARSYLYGYKIPGFMTGISGMGYSLLRDLYPELPCILALEI
ncbi:type 2 lantipeptide synthetase LanM [Mediterraneibacter gnavus]|uniref:Type 2 lantipeptide synthetase LanM n=1 Tax=Mediterraneibacter gnavus TaxID=33038 RepID=A0A3E4UMZ0_MEDGN|nr:type 2 lantipeptide synthetase LanM [Mediterraneibacter gnavus]